MPKQTQHPDEQKSPKQPASQQPPRKIEPTKDLDEEGAAGAPQGGQIHGRQGDQQGMKR